MHQHDDLLKSLRRQKNSLSKNDSRKNEDEWRNMLRKRASEEQKRSYELRRKLVKQRSELEGKKKATVDITAMMTMSTVKTASAAEGGMMIMIVAEAGQEVQEETHEAKEGTPRIDKTIEKGRQAGMTGMRGLLPNQSTTIKVENVTMLEGETMTPPETAGEMTMREEKVGVVTMMIGGDRSLV